MAIIVKKYNVRYNGIRYGPSQPAGAVVTGLSKEEEARLVAGSGGTIEKYITRVIEAKDLNENREPEPNKSENGKEIIVPALEHIEFPKINPEDLIKPNPGPKKKRQK